MQSRFFRISIGIMSLLFRGGQMMNITRLGSFFPSYDPYYHYAITQQYLNTQAYSSAIDQAVVPTQIIYTTIAYTRGQITQVVTGFSLHEIFQVTGPFLLWIGMVTLALMVRKMTTNIRLASGVFLLWGSAPYILTRHSMFLPENFALLLLILLIYTLWKRKVRWTYLILFVYGYVHYRSWYIPFALFGAYWFIEIISLPLYSVRMKIKSILVKLLVLPVILLISYPINLEFFSSMRYLIQGFLGFQQDRSAIAPNQSLYTVPTIPAFVEQIGLLQTVTIGRGVVITLMLLIQKKRLTTLHRVLFLVTVVLCVSYFSRSIAKHIPSYRFAAYILLFGLIHVSIAIRTISFSLQTMGVLTVLCIFSIFSRYTEHGWSGLTDGDIHVLKYLHESYPQTPLISLGGPLYTLHHHSERDPQILSDILYTPTGDQLIELLQKRYDTVTDELIIVLTTNQVKTSWKTPLPIYEILKQFPVIYADTGAYTTAFYVDLQHPGGSK